MNQSRHDATARTASCLLSSSALTDTFFLSPHLDLRRLRYFLATAEELHFGRAAERLQIAQPALSQQIRKLEAELGVNLFHRSRGKRVVLTEPGEVLLEEGRRVLQRASVAALSAQRAARGEIGRLRVGFAPSSAVGVLPLGVRLFRERRPQVGLELTEYLSDELANALRNEDFDVGILRAPTNPAGLALDVIAEEPLYVALPAGHRLADVRRRIDIRELADDPLIASSRTGASGWHRDVFALYRSAGLTPTVAQEVSTIQAQLGLVAAALGVALLPSSVSELRPRGVSMVPVEAPLLKLYVAYPLDRPTPAPLTQFLECIKEAGRRWSLQPSAPSTFGAT